MIKNGKDTSKFHHVLSEHDISLQNWLCRNKRRRHSITPSIYSLLGTNIHTDLQKLQAELGAELSYGQGDRVLQILSTRKRQVNNRERIRRTVNRVGERLDEFTSLAPTDEADELFVNVDGGYVHHWDERGKNFEIF